MRWDNVKSLTDDDIIVKLDYKNISGALKVPRSSVTSITLNWTDQESSQDMNLPAVTYRTESLRGQ